MKFVVMKNLEELVSDGTIEIEHISDDGEYMRLKILPDGPTYGMCVPDGPMQVVDGRTVRRSMVENHPQLFKEVTHESNADIHSS
jgi:hypothetical protein